MFNCQILLDFRNNWSGSADHTMFHCSSLLQRFHKKTSHPLATWKNSKIRRNFEGGSNIRCHFCKTAKHVVKIVPIVVFWLPEMDLLPIILGMIPMKGEYPNINFFFFKKFWYCAISSHKKYVMTYRPEWVCRILCYISKWTLKRKL